VRAAETMTTGSEAMAKLPRRSILHDEDHMMRRKICNGAAS
jgi:hypothetical protein